MPTLTVVYIRTCMHLHMHTQTRMHTNTSTGTSTNTNMGTQTQVQTQTHTHTHTHTQEDIIDRFDINVCSVAMLLNSDGGFGRHFVVSESVREAIRERSATHAHTYGTNAQH
jgi:hypothetical protein